LFEVGTKLSIVLFKQKALLSPPLIKMAVKTMAPCIGVPVQTHRHCWYCYNETWSKDIRDKNHSTKFNNILQRFLYLLVVQSFS